MMTIRAKFTAQPGTQFVIRREAYRRITEALAAKGIHYAHRKVIVDMPQPALPDGDEPGSNTQSEKAVNAAGAAAMAAIQQEEEALQAKQQQKE